MKQFIITIMLLCMTTGAFAIDQCKAITKANKQCKKEATVNGYCSTHNPDRVKCKGTTKAGKPCGLAPSKGEAYCYHHKK